MPRAADPVKTRCTPAIVSGKAAGRRDGSPRGPWSPWSWPSSASLLSGLATSRFPEPAFRRGQRGTAAGVGFLRHLPGRSEPGARVQHLRFGRLPVGGAARGSVLLLLPLSACPPRSWPRLGADRFCRRGPPIGPGSFSASLLLLVIVRSILVQGRWPLRAASGGRRPLAGSVSVLPRAGHGTVLHRHGGVSLDAVDSGDGSAGERLDGGPRAGRSAAGRPSGSTPVDLGRASRASSAAWRAYSLERRPARSPLLPPGLDRQPFAQDLLGAARVSVPARSPS